MRNNLQGTGTIVPGVRKNLHILAAKFHPGTRKSKFRFYPYQLTVQWQDSLRHGTCMVLGHGFVWCTLRATELIAIGLRSR